MDPMVQFSSKDSKDPGIHPWRCRQCRQETSGLLGIHENLGLVRSGMPDCKKVGALWSVLGSILQPEVTQPSVAGTEPRDLNRCFSNSAAIGGAEQGGDSGADPW